MNDEPTPPKPPGSDPIDPGGAAPPPPPGGGPTGSTGAGAPPPPPTGGGASDNRQIMLILSYLWILALIPYLTEQRDPEVKWHSRHGLVLVVAEIVLNILLFILTLLPVIGCAFSLLWMVAWIGVVVLHVVCLVKALNGERFTIPYVSQYVNQIP